MRICAVVFPRLTQLDLTGPYEVFSRVPDSDVALVAETMQPVRSEFGLPITPTATFDKARQCDVLFVPGGPGVNDAMLDDRLLDFVRRQAQHARYVTSVCTGALILGAAGLLDGYRAATHWSAMEFLPLFGATAVEERVVIDRNRITAGGVTAGIDYALFLVAQMQGPELARSIEIAIEYRNPRDADPSIVENLRRARSEAQERRRIAVEHAAGKLR